MHAKYSHTQTRSLCLRLAGWLELCVLFGPWPRSRGGRPSWPTSSVSGRLSARRHFARLGRDAILPVEPGGQRGQCREEPLQRDARAPNAPECNGLPCTWHYEVSFIHKNMHYAIPVRRGKEKSRSEKTHPETHLRRRKDQVGPQAIMHVHAFVRVGSTSRWETRPSNRARRVGSRRHDADSLAAQPHQIDADAGRQAQRQCGARCSPMHHATRRSK